MLANLPWYYTVSTKDHDMAITLINFLIPKDEVDFEVGDQITRKVVVTCRQEQQEILARRLAYDDAFIEGHTRNLSLKVIAINQRTDIFGLPIQVDAEVIEELQNAS